MSVNLINTNEVYITTDAQPGKENKAILNVETIKSNEKITKETSQLQSNINADATMSARLEKENAAQADTAEKSPKELEEEALVVSDAMKTISEFISMPIRTVNFTQDDGSEKTVIKIFDSENNELIKQFPSEEILSIAQRIVELREDVSKKTGILLDESI